ncbi:hypothetical protein AVEN_158939-1 [Araneus ventricosus]|uniref:Secreted protein n=1 Tax=Araneus ventricosus TaxID=182803 RepID=A0A4Y2B8W8_ARAVE|nr:hypothetical protein AVEN_158939-1 [Araneus ventricosus]
MVELLLSILHVITTLLNMNMKAGLHPMEEVLNVILWDGYPLLFQLFSLISNSRCGFRMRTKQLCNHVPYLCSFGVRSCARGGNDRVLTCLSIRWMAAVRQRE